MYTFRAICQAELGDYRAAFEDANAAANLDLTDPTPVYIRCGARFKLGATYAAYLDYLYAKTLDVREQQLADARRANP